MDRPMIYQIRVQGRLDERWSDWFNGMTITVESGGDGSPISMLTGAVTDQSALLGILIRIGYLNLTLISVNRIETNSKDGL